MALCSASIALNAQTYTAVELPPLPGGTVAYVSAINNAGQAIGESNTAPNQIADWVIIWNGETPTEIATGGGIYGVGAGVINNAGIMTGETVTQSNFYPWYWYSGIGSFSFMNGNYFSAYIGGINDSGQIVSAANTDYGLPFFAVIWQNPFAENFSYLPTLVGFSSSSYAGAINNGGEVVGSSSNAAGVSHATLWTSSGASDLGTLGGPNSGACGINASGLIVGTSDTSSGASHAVSWANGKIIDLGTLGGTTSGACAINTVGQVAGFSDTTLGAAHAALFLGGKVIDLNSVVTPALPAGVTLTEATGINDNGWIAVEGTNSQTNVAEAFILKPNPFVPVHLSSVDNIVGIAVDGLPVPNGGLDGSGDAYSARLMQNSVTWSNRTFSFGAAGTLNSTSAKTIALPVGNATTLSVLGTSSHGAQINQPFIVTYADGTTSTFSQSMSDWHTPQYYSGESIVLTMPYRVTAGGADKPGPYYLYGYRFAVNSAKVIESVKLPNNRDIAILAVDVTGAGSLTPTALTPIFSPAAATYMSRQNVTLSDGLPGTTIYFTLDGTTPTTASARYGSPLAVNSTTTIKALAVTNGYSNSAIAKATYTIAPQNTGPVGVNLASVANVVGIGADGTPVPKGGIDGNGDAYSANLTGKSLSWSGLTFNGSSWKVVGKNGSVMLTGA